MIAPCLVLLASAFTQARESRSPLESGLVRSVELKPLPGTFVQHFRLDAPQAREPASPQALLRFVAGPGAEGGLRVELELEYLGQDPLRVIQTEQALRAERRLVFREIGERTGRTLLLCGTDAGGFGGHELGNREVVRRTLTDEVVLPLLLIESVRHGWVPPPEVQLLDPLAARAEASRISVQGGPEVRVLEARRTDGSLRWRVTFHGTGLDEWRWQEAGPIARAISPAEYDELRSTRDLARIQAREAAAAVRARGPID